MNKIYALVIAAVIIATGCAAAVLIRENGNGNETSTEDGEGWPRIITDAGGNVVELEKKPERIALLHTVYLEYLLALGVVPAASAGASVGTAADAVNTWATLESYRDSTENIIDLGSARELSLEAILDSDPDVIITFVGHAGVDIIYDRLVMIAPVVLMNYSDTWQEQMKDLAEIVGKESEALKVIEEIEEIVYSAKNTLSSKDKTFAIFRTGGGKSFITRGDAGYYEMFGLKAPQGWPTEMGPVLTLEAVAGMNPDYIVFQDTLSASKMFVESQEAFATWGALEAVKNNNVFFFDDSLNSLGPLTLKLTAQLLLDVYSE
ncbi:MAG: ABC transporter substrate-binding protein [Candidatus Methanoplasma sp.]|jgi:iron complex transport system substrate-binding protein|nr:ABC transporter substrate-binding protein [Candidatus Methanoplasma sp.]